MTDIIPFRENALFRGGHNAHMNACVGDNGGPYDLYNYAQGFLEAADVVIKRSDRADAVVDILVYPACFNFRHGIELFVKYSIDTIKKIGGDAIVYRYNHSLLDNWRIVREKFDPYSRTLEPNDLAFVEEVIRCFDEVDPNGQIFRCPESIKGDQHLKDWSLINLDILGSALSNTIRIFKELHFEMDGDLEASWERD